MKIFKDENNKDIFYNENTQEITFECNGIKYTEIEQVLKYAREDALNFYVTWYVSDRMDELESECMFEKIMQDKISRGEIDGRKYKKLL